MFKIIAILALVFVLQIAAQSYSRPYRYGYEYPYAYSNSVGDPYGNLGTRSSWQDQIVLHLFGR